MIDFYYTYNKETLVVNQKGISTTRFSALREYPRDALLVKPSEPKEGFVVRVCNFENGRPTSTEYVADHRGKTIYSITNTETDTVKELGPIKEGWTLLERPSKYHIFENDKWVLTDSGNSKQLNAAISDAKTNIDTTALSILNQWTAFADSYAETEAEAIAFTEQDYTGDMGPNLTAYCIAAGVSPKTAAITVLKKAKALRAAKTELNVVRSRKHSLNALTDLDAIKTLSEDIIADLLIVKKKV